MRQYFIHHFDYVRHELDQSSENYRVVKRSHQEKAEQQIAIAAVAILFILSMGLIAWLG
ncbi:MAG: hypothetical protein JWO43_515 [Candidatus Adlerbacteria bacterium]|nr:hypothetical protein [Candidatus Adlerbacteria bacterium]